MTTIFTESNLHRAYLDCRKTKRNTPEALKFEINFEENLAKLRQELIDRTWCPGTSTCFVSSTPKLREIFAADFRDRIVHHLLVRFLQPQWERRFIYDSYASRPEKGIHRAVDRLQKFTRKVTQNNTRPAWFLQIDIRNFFMSIDQRILFAVLKGHCQNPELLWLAQTIIFHDPTLDYHRRSPQWLLDQIPRQKSLFGSGEAKGLPIGNLTSQFFANVYLNSLDQFIKHTLKCHFYIRYVDDLVLLHHDPAALLKWKIQIEQFLNQHLDLELHPQRQKRQPVSNGIDFLGYIIRPDYILCRNRVVNNCQAKLRVFKKRLIEENESIRSVCYSVDLLEELMATINSYLGHFSHGNTFRLRQTLFRKNSWLAYFFDYRKTKGKDAKLRRLYEPARNFFNLRQQYNYFIRKFPRDLVFFQVGCFYEFYDQQAKWAINHLKLKPISLRFGFRSRCGIGQKGLDRYVAMAIAAGFSVTIVQQTGYELQWVKERRVTMRYIQLPKSLDKVAILSKVGRITTLTQRTNQDDRKPRGQQHDPVDEELDCGSRPGAGHRGHFSDD